MHLAETVCPLDCPDTCGLLAAIEEGKITTLSGDPTHPVTQGIICRKMKGYVNKVYSEQRILTPLLRDGQKGNGRFKRISWDDAWAVLTEKLHTILNTYGGEAVLPFCYAGNMGKVNRNAGFPFFHKIGATRIKQTICSASAGAGWKKQCHDTPGSPPEKVLDAKVVVCWGINAKVTSLHFWKLVMDARKRGAKLVVIDPYRNSTGRMADYYYSINPGGDNAFALAIFKYLLETDKLNPEYVEKDTNGFQSFKQYVEKASWQQLCKTSGVSYKTVEEVATVLTSHPETFIRIGVGLTRNSRGGAGIRSIINLGKALGLFEAGKGRGIFCFSGAFRGGNAHLVHDELLPAEPRTINMIELGKALNQLDPAVKALIVYNSNPLSVAPDSGMVRQGLLRDDLFTVVHEHTMTPTARYADIILPATTFLENRDVYTAYGHFFLKVVDKVIEPVGEALSNFDFFNTWAQKMGFDDDAFYETVDDRIRYFLEDLDGLPEQVTVEQAMAGVLTESTYKNAQENLLQVHNNTFTFCDGNDAYPNVGAGVEFDNADYMVKYPFKLLTPPHDDLLNSTFGEKFENSVQQVLVHPEDASAYGIQNGNQVILSNHRGTVVREAKITDDTQKGLLVAEGLFWQDQFSNGINELTSQTLSDLNGGAIFHESRVALAMKKT